jgi:hypothetical protein
MLRSITTQKTSTLCSGDTPSNLNEYGQQMTKQISTKSRHFKSEGTLHLFIILLSFSQPMNYVIPTMEILKGGNQ